MFYIWSKTIIVYSKMNAVIALLLLAVGCSSQQNTNGPSATALSSPSGCRLPAPPQHGNFISPQCQKNANLPQCRGGSDMVPAFWLLAYTCQSGYKLPKNLDVYYSRCFNGIWAPVPPVCLDQKVANYITTSSMPKPISNPIPGGCLLPKNPVNGRYFAFACTSGKTDNPACQYIPGTPVPPDWTLTYTCDSGYVKQFSGGRISQYVRCTNGSWDVIPPACIKPCSSLVSKTQTFRCFHGANEVDCNQPMMSGTIATYQCLELWSRDRRDNEKLLSCTTEGKWTYKPPPCQPACGMSLIDHKHPRIIDGDPSPLGNFPWHAGVYHRAEGGQGWNQFCGGTLIKPNIILTAAFCVVKEGQDRRVEVMKAQDLKIALGKYFRDWNKAEDTQVKRSVAEVAVPKNYRGSSTNFESDLALLRLTEDVPLSKLVMPVCFDTTVAQQPTNNVLGYITGWGNSERIQPSDTVLYCSWPFQDYDTCFQNLIQKKDGYISSDKFCAGVEVREAARKSVGGGFSFVFNNQHYIYGLLSSQVVRRDEIEYLKDQNYPVFTNITHTTHNSWIKLTTDKWENDYLPIFE